MISFYHKKTVNYIHLLPVSVFFRNFAADYENDDETALVCMDVVIGISADTATLVASCP
jgi:hypothetical protein